VEEDAPGWLDAQVCVDLGVRERVLDQLAHVLQHAVDAWGGPREVRMMMMVVVMVMVMVMVMRMWGGGGGGRGEEG
jgi:hypothetical protein